MRTFWWRVGIMSKLMPNKTLKLSVVLATRNEEENIGRCLASVKDIADEIIVVDEYSTDKTREIAEKYGAKVFTEPHHDIFHITKEKAL
ncbi:MAG: Beta 1,4 glucosyltransferase, partial [uncultured bacterium]